MIVVRPQVPRNYPYDGVWGLATESLVHAAFAGRPVCFLTSEPQLEWGDMPLEELGLPVSRSVYQGYYYKSSESPSATPETLWAVAQSTDFQHGALRVAVASPSAAAPCRRFVHALHAVRRLYPDAKSWSRLSPQERAALFEQVEEAKLSTQHEFMECDHDWDGVYWYHPNPERLTRAKEALRMLADARGWGVEMDGA